MPLFDVPGWSVADVPLAEPQNTKKRKRPSSDGGAKLETAHIDFDKLMEKLDAGNATSQPGKKEKHKTKKQGKKKGVSTPVESVKPPRVAGGSIVPQSKKHKRGRDTANEQVDASTSTIGNAMHERSVVESDNAVPHERRKKTKQRDRATAPADEDDIADRSRQPVQQHSTLTKHQASMKNSLEGARFRWINEVLYKSDSAHAHELMRDNPAVYEEYHTGFRHQVQSWPTNPVGHYISSLSAYPVKTVIADLGCGDAALARALVPRGFTVLSFDLVSDDLYVIEADTCGRLPLPGSEHPDKVVKGTVSEGEGGVVDVVVCALSLMGTNWPNCIREAWRVLRSNGELKIAEVASRFTNPDEFVSFICSFGFRLKAKDDSNTHFTLFDFKRVAQKPKGEKEWERLLGRGSILKPCEYKRR